MIIQNTKGMDFFRPLVGGNVYTTEERNMVFDQIPMPACMVNVDQKSILQINQSLGQLLDEKNITLSNIQIPFNRFSSEKRLFNEQISISTQKGELNLLATSSTSSDEHVVIYFQDLTYTQKLEEDLKTIKTSQIGFWSADPVTGLCHVCPTMAKDWGLQHLPNPITAEVIMNAVHPDDRGTIWASVENALLNDVPYYAEYRVVRPDGRIVWIEGRGEYLKDQSGQAYKFCGTCADVTDKMNERDKLLKELEASKQTIQNLKHAQETAEYANKNKTMFLANVSHEIRTPLTAILGFAEMLKDGPLSDIERNQFVDTMNRNGNALIKIIDDVLDLSKVEANCLELENIELSLQQLLHEVINQFKEKARAKNIYILLDIQSELPEVILADSVRLQQILMNLLSNAIKFTDQGGIIVQVKSIFGQQDFITR